MVVVDIYLDSPLCELSLVQDLSNWILQDLHSQLLISSHLQILDTQQSYVLLKKKKKKWTILFVDVDVAIVDVDVVICHLVLSTVDVQKFQQQVVLEMMVLAFHLLNDEQVFFESVDIYFASTLLVQLD